MKLRKAGALLLPIIIMAYFSGCSSPSVSGASNAQISSEKISDKKRMPQAELQDALLRFVSTFTEDLRQSFTGVEASADPAIRQQASTNRLIYSSSSLAIALGTTPESDLLDLVTFVELSRNVFAKYWLPKYYGNAALPILDTFNESQTKIQMIASRVLTPSQMSELQEIIGSWEEDHPNQVAVEGVRLTDFAAETGARAKKRQEQTGGLLSSVNKASVAAEEAVLLGERALFYAQYAPFLIRLQARVAAPEILGSMASALSKFSVSKDQMSQMNNLLLSGTNALREGQNLTSVVDRLIETVYKNRSLDFSNLRNDSIQGLVHALDEYNRALQNPNYAQGLARVDGVTHVIEASSRKLLWGFLFVGIALILFSAIAVFLSRIAFALWKESRPPRTLSSDRSEKKAA